jgi:hypothetical protein
MIVEVGEIKDTKINPGEVKVKVRGREFIMRVDSGAALASLSKDVKRFLEKEQIIKKSTPLTNVDMVTLSGKISLPRFKILTIFGETMITVTNDKIGLLPIDLNATRDMSLS